MWEILVVCKNKITLLTSVFKPILCLGGQKEIHSVKSTHTK